MSKKTKAEPADSTKKEPEPDWNNVVKVAAKYTATPNVFHRAIYVARYLRERQIWDGKRVIVINNPVLTQANIDLFSYFTPKLGEHYWYDE